MDNEMIINKNEKTTSTDKCKSRNKSRETEDDDRQGQDRMDRKHLIKNKARGDC